jgi:hypothetical protein
VIKRPHRFTADQADHAPKPVTRHWTCRFVWRDLFLMMHARVPELNCCSLSFSYYRMRICKCCIEHQQHGSSCALRAPGQQQLWPPGIVIRPPRCSVSVQIHKIASCNSFVVHIAILFQCPAAVCHVAVLNPAVLPNQPCSKISHHSML